MAGADHIKQTVLYMISKFEYLDGRRLNLYVGDVERLADLICVTLAQKQLLVSDSGMVYDTE